MCSAFQLLNELTCLSEAWLMIGFEPIGVNGRSPNVAVSDLDFHRMWSGRGRGNRGVEKTT